MTFDSNIFRLKFFLLIFFISITNLVWCQKKDNIEQYYAFVHKAEISIVESKFDSALYYYKKSIKCHSIYSDDCYNACLCALECKKYSDATLFASKLIDRGVPYSFFARNKSFSILSTTNEFKKYLFKKSISPKYNHKLRTKLDSMLVQDQMFRSDNIKYKDSVKIKDSLLYNDLWNIFNNYSFPSDDILGLWMINDTLINFGWNPLDVLLIHQIKNNRNEFIPFLEKSVLNGSMENNSFVSHSKNFAPNPYFVFGCLKEIQAIIIQVDTELFTCCCEEEKIINKNREKIYLDSLSDKRLKIKFKYEKDKRFLIGSGVAVYSTVNGPSDLEKIKQELINRKFIVYKNLNTNTPYND